MLSDTHFENHLIDIPKNIQIVIHCGDVCNAGDLDSGFGSKEIGDFVSQFYSKCHIFLQNLFNCRIETHKNSQCINASTYHKLCQKESQ